MKWKQPLKGKVFQKEHYPFQVRPRPQPHYNISKNSSEEPDLPPGFENYCAAKPNVSNIPLIKWKRPLYKFSFDPAWRVEAGGESIERETQNLRNSKLLEAIYPYPSTIPSQPAVSKVVEAETFDDSKTPVIPITEIEDKLESKEESSSSHNTAESGFSALQKLVSSLPPVLSIFEKEHGSKVDTDLLVKLLSDPEMVKKLLTGTTGEIQPSTNVEKSIVASQKPFTNPEQSIVASQQPFINLEQSIVASHQPFTNVDQRIAASHHQPLTNVDQRIVASHQPLPNVEQRIVASHQPLPNPEQRRVPPPMPGNGNISSLRPMSEQSLSAWLSSISCVSRPKEQPLSSSSVIAREQALSAWLASRSLPANLYRPQMATGLVQPMTTKDHAVRKLIREHGKDNHGETNQNRLEAGIVNRGNNGDKVRKQCIYFGTARGCRNGDACLFLHDRAEAPMAKKIKFGRYMLS